jgi:hypothetical protein
MRRFIRTAAVIVALGIPAIAAAPASANGPLGGCPPGGPGGGWQLIWSTAVSSIPPPYPWGPGADFVDQHGNNDGYACKVVFTNGAGETVGQVIDNLVQAP